MLGDRLNRLDGREKFGLLIVMLFLIAMVLDWIVVRPINKHCAWLDADILRERKTLQYQRGVLEAGPAVDARYAAIGPRLGPSLPVAEAKNAMKGEIERIAQDSDIALIATKEPVARPAPSGAYDEYALEISDFETDEQGMLRFMHTVMTGGGTYRVSRLKLAPDASGKRLKGAMTVTKVMVPAPKAAPAAPASVAPATPAAGAQPKG